LRPRHLAVFQGMLAQGDAAQPVKQAQQSFLG
jgi:hypothetical protein